MKKAYTVGKEPHKELRVKFSKTTHQPIDAWFLKNCNICTLNTAEICDPHNKEDRAKCPYVPKLGEAVERDEVTFMPIPTKDCDTCEIYLAGKCDQIAFNEETNTSLCPFDKEEEKQ
jgi:hypothetical protein